MAVQPLNQTERKRVGVEPFHGYPPQASYIVRAPSMAYAGVTQTLEFSRGEARAPGIGTEANERAWNRGERLSRLAMAGYRVYVEGTQPPRDQEPMWEKQIEEEAASGPTDFDSLDFGVDVDFGAPAGSEDI